MSDTNILPGTKIKVTVEPITPTVAVKYLEKNTSNRKIRKSHVARLASDMKAGIYEFTGQGIAFDTKGTLLDGQHRLTAVVESGTSQYFTVTRGLPTESQQTMDGGAKRVAPDFMKGSNTAARSAALRVFIGVTELEGLVTLGSLSRAMGAVTTAAILDVDDDVQALAESFAGLAARAQRSTPSASASPLVAAAVLLGAEKGQEFLEGIETGAGLEAGDPRLAISRYVGTKKRVQTGNSALLSLKCATAFAEGRKIASLRISASEVVDLTSLPYFSKAGADWKSVSV